LRKTIDRRLVEQGDRGKDRSGYESLDVHRPRLALDLRLLLGVKDWLRAAIQIAQTARCEPHSSSVPRLKEPQRPREQRDEERESPNWPHALEREDRRDHNADKQRGHAENESLLPFTWTDVGYAAFAGVHEL
jgi:hypothetical protein